ncbi:MAG: TIGR00282 family metallophosphoesterase [Spartobacteria bacterium]|nr:TIGR00282 family metallophosphoesterase [Spartobacteria bacterium]
MKILIAGDVVSSPGRAAIARFVTEMKLRGEIDMAIVNAENVAGGNGIIPRLGQELFAAGADVLTLGDHTWDKKEAADYIGSEQRVVRPANYPPGCPGRGWYIHRMGTCSVAVISLLGRTFMPPQDCPFRVADAILARPDIAQADIRIVDFHAEATSEKNVMGYYLDGRVTAVVGTHTHVQTSDEKILPKGTGYITDLGMTGPLLSILGRDIDAVTRRFVTGLPTRFEIAKGPAVMEGVIISIGKSKGRCSSIKRIRKKLDM